MFPDLDAIQERVGAESDAILCDRAQAGDADARERMVVRHLPLVIHIAKRYRKRGLDFDDLIQEGAVGLLDAIDTFEPARKTTFATHATWHILRHIRHAIRHDGRTVRVPDGEFNAACKATEIARTLGLDPMDDRLGEHLGWTRVETERHRDAFRALRVASLYHDDSAALVRQDRDERTPDEVMARAETDQMVCERLRRAMVRLDSRQQDAITMRFGLAGDGEPMEFYRIGDALGITRQRAHQIVRDALRTLRRSLESLRGSA